MLQIDLNGFCHVHHWSVDISAKHCVHVHDCPLLKLTNSKVATDLSCHADQGETHRQEYRDLFYWRLIIKDLHVHIHYFPLVSTPKIQ